MSQHHSKAHHRYTGTENFSKSFTNTYIGGTGHNVFGFIEFDTEAQAQIASQNEVDVRGQRIRVEPKEYSARRHTRLAPHSISNPVDRPRTIAWGPSIYQTPTHMPYGFQPIYIQQTPGGPIPFGQGMPWATPPHSGQRRRQNTGQFYIGSPPGPTYIPAEHVTMPPYQGQDAGNQPFQSRGFR